MNPVTIGLIVGNRGFFPSHLCEEGRAEKEGGPEEKAGPESRLSVKAMGAGPSRDCNGAPPAGLPLPPFPRRSPADWRRAIP